MSTSLDSLVNRLASRLIDLEDFLETDCSSSTSKVSMQYDNICLAIDRLDEAIADAEQAQNAAEEEEEEEEDE